MRENADQKNSEHRLILRSVDCCTCKSAIFQLCFCYSCTGLSFPMNLYKKTLLKNRPCLFYQNVFYLPFIIVSFKSVIRRLPSNKIFSYICKFFTPNFTQLFQFLYFKYGYTLVMTLIIANILQNYFYVHQI